MEEKRGNLGTCLEDVACGVLGIMGLRGGREDILWSSDIKENGNGLASPGLCRAPPLLDALGP
jgi:hypothetical protein